MESMSIPSLPKIKSNSIHSLRVLDFFNTDCSKRTDFDVFLKSYNRNLQRDYCWNNLQQNELIHSIIKCRHIPPISVVCYGWPVYKKDINNATSFTMEDWYKFKYQVIDGKQRLITHKKFIDNEFSIKIEGVSYFFSDLPHDYQNRIVNHTYSVNMFDCKYFGDATDEELLDFFKWCNFAGTPQDKDYLLNFKK